MNLDFLKDVKLDAVAKTAPKTKVSVDLIPEKADIRVFANGRVFPSKDFAKRWELEFEPKINIASEGEEPIMDVIGNGLDIFSSLDWGMIKGKLPEELIFCTAVPKRLAKVDMWASTKYTEDNTPKASVFTQGLNTFAKERLIPMLTEVYKVNWDITEFVDLKVVEDSVISSENGIYTIPKVVSTGPKKGQPDYIRRENLTICPLVVADVKFSEKEVATTTDIIKTTTDIKEPSVEEIVEEDTMGGSLTTESATADLGDDWASKLGAN